ncbi:hypothetical protein MHK_001463, partial [Candidatus Magnetomorum sp. HK-1]
QKQSNNEGRGENEDLSIPNAEKGLYYIKISDSFSEVSGKNTEYKILVRTLSAPAGDSCSIHGMIRNKDDNSPIKLVEVETSSFGHAASDSRGRFEINNISTGKQILSIMHQNFHLKRITIDNIDHNSIYNIDIYLIPNGYIGKIDLIVPERIVEGITIKGKVKINRYSDVVHSEYPVPVKLSPTDNPRIILNNNNEFLYIRSNEESKEFNVSIIDDNLFSVKELSIEIEARAEKYRYDKKAVIIINNNLKCLIDALKVVSGMNSVSAKNFYGIDLKQTNIQIGLKETIYMFQCMSKRY